jgi:hypothetical protein
MDNTPNKYYSCMNHCPLYYSIGMILFSPILIYMKSKKLNNFINKFFYLVKLFVPFILLYWTVNIILTPFAYIKTLYWILCGNYKNKSYKSIKKEKKRIILFTI